MAVTTKESHIPPNRVEIIPFVAQNMGRFHKITKLPLNQGIF